MATICGVEFEVSKRQDVGKGDWWFYNRKIESFINCELETIGHKERQNQSP
jgi:hypothetical protein